jgi:hypothetical protein
MRGGVALHKDIYPSLAPWARKLGIELVAPL